ncbi:acyl carrier protein [Brevibacillus humidisoli]|uniref:acyl carrier protein n=1 Tax=Brevibacillus humidisoli TaxID=2895522 RepID=UPI001E4A61E6|nr:acyl carrier protein [Brevibacillus humidisoli]UFJ41784.1 acyl carrier protein [Brevibacillus humidisoli]
MDRLETLVEHFHRYLRGERHPDIIAKDATSPLPAASDQDQARIQSCLEKQAWHDIAKQWVHGIDISWESFFHPFHVRRIPLPTYCFEQQSFPIPKPASPILDHNHSMTKTRTVIGDLAQMPRDVDGLDTAHGTTSMAGNGNRQSDHVVQTGHAVDGLFRDVFAKIINIPADHIELSAPLDQYGFDSTMVISVANELENYFGTVPKTLFFECQTIQEVIDYFVQEYRDKIPMIMREKDRDPVNHPLRSAVAQSARSEGQDQREQADDEDMIEDLTQAILSDRISAEMILKKL